VSAHASDHDRVVSCGAWFALIPIMLILGLIDKQVPQVAGWLLDWAIFLAVTVVIARWKRSPVAYAACAGMVAVSVFSAIYKTTFWSRGMVITQPDWYGGLGIMFCWYWLIRSGRKVQAPVPALAIQRSEQHVYHHVVHHLPQTAVTMTAEREEPASKVISGNAVKAIEPAKTRLRVLRERALSGVTGPRVGRRDR
jgi:hypothetical protein